MVFKTECKNFYNNLSAMLKNFFSSAAYIFLVALIVFLSWFYKSDIVSFYLLFVFLIIIFLTQNNLLGVIPIFAFGLFAYSGNLPIAQIKTFCFIILPFFVVSLVFFIVKNRRNFNISKCRMFYPFLALVVIALFSGLGNLNNFDHKGYLLILLATVIMLLLYFLISSSINFAFDRYFVIVMIAAGTIVVLQVLSFYLTCENVALELQNKSLTAGWGVSNAMASVLIMCFPFSLYFAFNSKYLYVVSVLLGICFLGGLLFTLSRGALFSMILVIVPLVIYLIVKSKYKLSIILCLSAIIIVCGLLIWYYRDYLKELLRYFSDVKLDGRGRWELYYEGFREFFKRPFFGGGFWLNYDKENFIRLYHNNYLQFMAVGGIFGLGFLIYHTVAKYKVIVGKKNIFCILCLFSMIAAEIYGLFDITYFAPQYILILCVMMVAAEKSSLNYQSEGELSSYEEKGRKAFFKN